MARIAFLSTGGTFANAGTTPTDYLSYLTEGKVLPAAEVLELLPREVRTDLLPVPFAALRSKEIGPAQWRGLAAEVTRLCADPQIEGVIVAHGTGVLEETAYYLHLTVDTDKPVVLIGAQRPPTTVSSDAAKNLLDAIAWVRAAEVGAAAGCGVVVVMDQTVHSARDVAKLANHTLGAMESPGSGPLGRINADGTVALHRRPRHRHTGASELAGGDFARVDIAHQYAGADATALRAFVGAGARGLVVVGFPPGTNTPLLDAAIEEHARGGLAIVQASRAIRDPQVLAPPIHPRVIRNTDLSPQHARILLGLALGAGLADTELHRVFTEY